MFPENPTVSNLDAESPCPTLEASVTATKTARRPRIWTVFVTWLVAAIAGEIAIFAGAVTFGVCVGAVLGAQGVDANTIQTRVQELLQLPLPALILSLLPYQLGFLAIVLLAARMSKEPLRPRLGLVAPQSGSPGLLRQASLAAFTVSAALASIVLSSLWLGSPPTNTPIAAVLADGSWWTITVASILLSVVPALVEEIAFRGYIQRRLLQRWSPAAAIGVTSLLFALLHVDSLQHIIAVIPLAIVTGLLAYRTNSVKPGMFVHAIHNTAAVAIGALAVALTPQLGDEGVGMLLLGSIVALGVIGLPAVIALVRNRPADAPVASPMGEVRLPELLTDSGLARQAF